MKSVEGWSRPLNSRKWHYFRGGRSLCCKWAYFNEELEQGLDDSPDNCAVCRRHRLAELKRTEGNNGNS